MEILNQTLVKPNETTVEVKSGEQKLLILRRTGEQP